MSDPTIRGDVFDQQSVKSALATWEQTGGAGVRYKDALVTLSVLWDIYCGLQRCEHYGAGRCSRKATCELENSKVRFVCDGCVGQYIRIWTRGSDMVYAPMVRQLEEGMFQGKDMTVTLHVPDATEKAIDAAVASAPEHLRQMAAYAIYCGVLDAEGVTEYVKGNGRRLMAVVWFRLTVEEAEAALDIARNPGLSFGALLPPVLGRVAEKGFLPTNSTDMHAAIREYVLFTHS